MPEEESVNLFRLNTIKEGDKMPCFIILLCLCLFPFSTAQCEGQTVVKSLDTSILTIWGGNGDESLSSTYHTSNGDIVLLAQTDSTLGTPALSSRTAGGTRDGWILRVSNMGELKSETLLSWEGTPFILGAVENPESLCMIVTESIDRTEYVEDTGYIVKYNIASESIQREELLGLPHDVYVCDRGLLVTGAYMTDSSHVAAWSAFVNTGGHISWSYCSPELYSENEIVFQKGVLRQNEIILYYRKPTEAPEKRYLRILDQNGQFLRNLPLPELDNFNIHGMLPTDEGLLIYGYKFENNEHAPVVFLHVALDGHILFFKTFSDMQNVLSVCPASQGGYYFVENTDDGLNLFYLSSDGETELQQSFSYDHLISCRNIYEEADGSLTCVGEMRIPTSDDRVQEKLFILHFPQKNKQPA